MFESDQSGTQQCYIMNSDGSNQRRISFFGGRCATPEWSPRGDQIAFTHIVGDFHIGVMDTSGRNMRTLTNNWQDEAPTWAPNGRIIQFFRTERNSGATSIWQVDLTGANERRVGRFESADGGTLFLDEIGEIDATTQIKLLRFLETRSVERLGSHKPIALDLRLVCATNRDLLQMVQEGKFREDLYYRLSVVPLRMPPLRERSDDIPLLLAHYLKRFAAENNLAEVRLAADALAVLARYPWPGNIRELRNTCENLAVLRAGKMVGAADLDARYTQPTSLGGSVRPVLPAATGGMFDKEQNEKELLKQALASAAGNRTKAAELLGISRRTLHRKLLQWPELEVGPPPHA